MFEEMGMNHWLAQAEEALSRLQRPRPKESKGRGGEDR